MIWTRDRYISHCQHQFTGREMFCELFGPMHILENEWRCQGATAKEIGMTAFDWDYVLHTTLAGITGPISDIQPRILEENEETRISIDHLGRTSKLCKKTATIPLPLDFPVETMENWLKIKHWYSFSENRIDREQLLQQKTLRNKGYLTLFAIPGGYDELRELMGEVNLSIAYYEQPELIEDILSTITDTCLKVLERVGDIVPIDNLIVHEDMAGKGGPLVGPKQVKQFIVPYYKKIWDAAQSYGARLFSQDSDGDMNAVIDAFMESGLQGFYPCEPAAGMEIVKLRQKYGDKLYFKGGIDKYALLKGKNEIRKELEYKMSASMLGSGGVIFGLDHRIPNGVTIENYRYYVQTGREILGLPAISNEGWARMAF